MNVLLFDGLLSGVEFFARLRTVLPPYYNYLMKMKDITNVFYAHVVLGQFVGFTGGSLPPVGHPHFPWGEDVDPDH